MTATHTTTADLPDTPAGEDRACSRCGLTETQLRTEGLMGCAACYETFADLVAQAAAALHGVTLAPPSAPALPLVSVPEPILTPAVTPATPSRKPLLWSRRRLGAPEPPPQPKGQKKRPKA